MAMSLALLGLSGCQNWASMIGLEAYEEDGQIHFRDAEASLFTTYCVRHIEVTAWRMTSETTATLEEKVWEDGARSADCLTGLPFEYGQAFDNSDPADIQPAQPLTPGLKYEIFIEQDGGAGQGSFMIEEDGTVVNL